MKKTTLRTLFTLLALLLVFTMIFTVAACAATEEPTEETKEETEDTSENSNFITNGNFSEVTGSEQPYSASSWYSYTSGSYTDTEKKVAGVIDTGAAYDGAKAAWDSLANPYGTATDNKLLMIYNKEANVYGYYATFSASIAAYYTISVKAKVVNAVGTGAYFRITSDNGQAIQTISNTDEFTTYTFYVMAPLTKSSTINVYLSLGFGKDKVSGYAFFDDVEAKKITSAEYSAAKADPQTNVKFVEMLQPDGEFDYYSSGSSAPYTPSSWSTATGGEVDGKALDTGYIKRGIVSTEEADWTTLSNSYTKYFAADANPGVSAQATDNGDKNVLAIRSIGVEESSEVTKYTPTAVGYTSKTSVRINMSTIYEISVWVKASVDTDDDHPDDADYYKERGAAVILNGTQKYSVKAIRTDNSLNNGWEKVVFYIIGNEFSAKDFTIELWLGTDDSAKTLTQGVAYFDKLVVEQLETFTAANREARVQYYSDLVTTSFESAEYKTRCASLVNLKSVKENMVTNHDFSSLTESGLPTGYTFSALDNVVVNDGDVITTMISADALAATDEQWTETYAGTYKIDKNPLYPYGFDSVLLVNNVIPSAYTLTQDQEIEVKQNLHYRLSIWVKTIDIADGNNLVINLLTEDDESKSSFSINTAKYSNELSNDYVECIFYIQGGNASDPNNKIKTNKVHLQFSYGSGSKYDPSGFKKGAYAIANINMEQITYSEYNSATTGDYAKKVQFAEDSTTLSNGNFNKYDLEKSEIDQDTGLPKLKDEFGNDGYYLAAIADSWTNNVNEGYGTTKVSQKTDKDDPSKEEEVKVNNLIAGILNINNIESEDNKAYLAQFGLDGVTIFNTWADTVIDETKEKSIAFGKPNVLMIATRGAASVKLKNTYKEKETDEEEKTNDKTESPAIKSPSISLNANSYYVLKFYARAIGEKAIGEVYLTTSSTDAEKAMHKIIDESGWVEYIFLVETGLSSVSANFEIYYGEKSKPDEEYKGTILFDGFTYVSIEKDAYEKYLTYESSKTTKFTTTTFDTGSTSSETAVKPALFSGTGESTSGYVNSDAQVAGVITYNSFKFEGADDKKTLGILTTETETDGDGNETTKDVLVEGSAMTRDAIFSEVGMEGATVGNYLLLINNRKANYYTYETSSMTVKSKSFYKFSAYVRTAWLEKGKNAIAKVTVGDDTYTIKVNTGTYDDEGTETIGGWKLINFYIRNDKDSDVSTVKLAFILGENTDNGKVQGYYFIDNVSLSTIDEQQFDEDTAAFYDFEKDENGIDVQTAANKEFRLSNNVIEIKADETTTDDNDDEDDNKDEESSGINTTLLWTYITSIAIAAVLIAVIVVWLIRKYRPKKSGSKSKSTASYDRNNAQKPQEDEEEGTGSTRDEYKD